MWVPIVILVILVTLPVAGSNCYNQAQNCFNYGMTGCESNSAYSGTHNYTLAGIPCQKWASTSPVSIAPKYRGLPNNYCRNIIKYEGPWCYALNPSRNWDFCFPDCKGCYDKARNCYNYLKTGCSGEFAYNGTRQNTVSGLLCQKWDSTSPVDIGTKYKRLPNNYCRNIISYDGPWCYTMHSKRYWDYCFLSCTECYDKARNCYNIGKKGCGKDRYNYNGTYDKTVSGIFCQTWDSNKPRKIVEKHRYLPKNYCRNPSSYSGGPWCYTMSPSIKWEKCFRDCKGLTPPPPTTIKRPTAPPAQPDVKQPPPTTTKRPTAPPVQPGCYDEQRDCFHVGRSGCDGKLIYNGTRSRTLNGYVCQKWALDKPQSHSYRSQPENYCRNPSGATKGPWCYTTNGPRYDYCFRDCRLQCLDEPVDLIVLMDASGSIGLTNFGKEKYLVIEIIKKLPANSRVAVLQFSDYHKWELQFDSKISLRRAPKVISKIIYKKERDTHIAKALQMAYDEAQRYNPNNVTMLTITDGHGRDWNDNEGTKYSNDIRNAGVASYAVAIGDAVDMSQLKEIVGIPARILTAQKFSELDEMFAERVIKKICTAPSGGSSQKKCKKPMQH